MAEATWTDLVRASGQAQLVGLCSASVGSETMGVSAWGWRPGQGTQDQATVRPLCGGTPDRKSETFPSFASLSLSSEWSWQASVSLICKIDIICCHVYFSGLYRRRLIGRDFISCKVLCTCEK